MDRIPKLISLTLSVIFLAIGALHFSETDFELWISIYIAAAFISIMVAFNRLSKSVVIAAMIAYLVGSIAQWPALFTGFAGPGIYSEQARESAGLFFCFLAMSFFVFLVVKKRSGIKNP